MYDVSFSHLSKAGRHFRSLRFERIILPQCIRLANCGAPRETRKPASSEGGCAAVRQGPPMRQWASPRARPRHCRAPVRASASPDTKRASPDTNQHEIPAHRLRRQWPPFREGRNAAVFVIPRGISCPAWRKARSARPRIGGGRGTCSPDRQQGMAVASRRRSFAAAGFRVPP